MKFGKKYIRLKTAIIFFVCMVVVLALVVTGFLIGQREIHSTKQELSDKVMDTARTVGHSPVVIEGLDGKRDDTDVANYADRIRKLTSVRFITVMDMDGIRLSHPDKWKIGKHFVGGDENRSLQGEEYLSTAEGTLGESLRAFEPIYNNEGKQVGAVAVGILLNHIHEEVMKSMSIIYIGIGVGVLVGTLGALLLARKIKKVLLGLEPFEIANLWQQRNAMLESVREGILAVDKDGKVIAANSAALQIFEHAGIYGEPVGKNIDHFLPNSKLPHVVETGEAEYDQERHLNGVTWVSNRVPIKVDGRVVGAITTLRDKTELKQLVEQLTGVKLYADALRVKSHEFMNKLHVIAGMVHIKEYDELSSYINQIAEQYQMEAGSISRLVRDPVLAGFLLSKISDAREHGVELNISGENPMPYPKQPEMKDDLITIMGNLIDNAIEAVEANEAKDIDVTIEYNDGIFSFSVEDHGGGIPEELQKTILEKGYSTKGDDRGYGLFLTQKGVQKLDGKLTVQSDGQWTKFKADIPYEEGG